MDMPTKGKETAFWLDFLDVPFVRHVEATIFEPHPDAFQRPTQRRLAFRIPLAHGSGQSNLACTVSRLPRM